MMLLPECRYDGGDELPVPLIRRHLSAPGSPALTREVEGDVACIVGAAAIGLDDMVAGIATQ